MVGLYVVIGFYAFAAMALLCSFVFKGGERGEYEYDHADCMEHFINEKRRKSNAREEEGKVER